MKDWHWSVWQAGGIHNYVKVLVKVLFSDNNSLIDTWIINRYIYIYKLIDIWNIYRYICKVLHKTRIITLLCLLWKLSPLEFGSIFIF